MTERPSTTTARIDHDHALGPVPNSERLPWPRMLSVTLGVMGAMVFLQLPGQLALAYGTTNAVVGLIYATLASGILACVFAAQARASGLNIGLISRGAGFGHRGAGIAALLYALNFIVLAAIEGSIMAGALHALWPMVPIAALMVALTLLNLLLNGFGIGLLDRLMRHSLPIYLLLLLAALWLATRHPPAATPSQVSAPFDLAAMLYCAGVLNGIVALQALLIADYARFMPVRSGRVALLAIGFAPQIASFLIMGLIGIWLAVRFAEANPGVYLVVLMGAWGALYTVVSQLRINLINLYSGSLSLANACQAWSRLRLNRWSWVGITASAALLMMLGGILEHAGQVLGLLGVVMFAWVASLLAELCVVRDATRSAPLEYRATRLPSWNPVGLGALALGVAVGGYCALFASSTLVNASSSLLGACAAFVCHLLLARGLGAQTSPPRWPSDATPNDSKRIKITKP